MKGERAFDVLAKRYEELENELKKNICLNCAYFLLVSGNGTCIKLDKSVNHEQEACKYFKRINLNQLTLRKMKLQKIY